MVVNEIVLEDMFSKPPTRDVFRYVFLVANSSLVEKIWQAGYMAVGIGTEEERETFLRVLEKCQWTYLKDRYFIPYSDYGTSGEIKKALEGMQFNVLPGGWKLFNDKEALYMKDRKSLEKALGEYIAKLNPNAGECAESEKIDLDMVSMAEVEEKAVDWLVLDYIPKGQITIMAGDGGSGKTSVWCEIAASVSSGRPCFLIKDMIPTGFEVEEPKKVMFFSAEDTLEHVIKGKLRQNGATMKNLLSLPITDERFDDVKFDSPYLEQLIEKYRPALMIFDPIQAFLQPNLEMSKRNSMRNCLRPLIGYGEKYGCTFLIVVHSNKQSGLWGRKRIADSADIWDIARSVFLIGETKENGIRYISHEKCNYGITGKTVLFSNSTGKVEFKGYTNKKDKDFITETNYSVRYAPQREEAKEFILEYLEDGEKEVSDLDAMAKAAGCSESALKRAKTDLKKEKRIDFFSRGNGHNKIHYARIL